MKQNNPQYKFVEWSSPEELHQESLRWISQLEFTQDEQQFLNTLIKNHTLQLISGPVYQRSLEVVSELSKEEKEVKRLLRGVRKHANALEILLDGINQLEEESRYKQVHFALKIEVSRYEENYMKTKREIFNIIKQILKQNKQKRITQ